MGLIFLSIPELEPTYLRFQQFCPFKNKPAIKKYFGPSTLVAAAFIGPGTLTTCTLAGVQTGYGMLWVLLLATGLTIFLQEMAARLGLVTQAGLGEAVRTRFAGNAARWLVFGLIIGAILVGNAAYQAGNLAGGVLGLDLLIGPWRWWTLVLGAICFALLFYGKYRWVERLLIALVVTMSICFLLTAVLVQPDWGAVARGFVPQSPGEANWLLVLAVLGTTVVPYNLFLHAATVSKKWKPGTSLTDLRRENAVSILLGGLISVLIVVTAAGSRGAVTEVTSAADLAAQLRPVFGGAAGGLMGVGLLAAGISSALTAPLAAAYAARGLFGWGTGERSLRFRAVWMAVLAVGVLVGTLGLKPVPVIKFAQVTNALLLPLIAGFLVYLCNSDALLGRFVNGRARNALAVAVLLALLGLAGRTFFLLL